MITSLLGLNGTKLSLGKKMVALVVGSLFAFNRALLFKEGVRISS